MQNKYGTSWKIVHSLHLIAIFIPIFGVIGFFRRKALSGQNRWLFVALIYLVMDGIALIASGSKTALADEFMDVYVFFYLATIVYACVTLPSYLRTVIARLETVAPAQNTASGSSPLNQVTFTVSHNKQKDASELPPDATLQKIRQLNDSFKDQAIYPQLTEIEAICVQILEYVSKNPEDKNTAHAFTNYYLPEYVKLMENYLELIKTPVKTEKITATIEQIQNSLPTTLVSFKNLYNNLYSDKAADISNSISVFEKMMSQDGLTESPDSGDSIHLKI